MASARLQFNRRCQHFVFFRFAKTKYSKKIGTIKLCELNFVLNWCGLLFLKKNTKQKCICLLNVVVYRSLPFFFSSTCIIYSSFTLVRLGFCSFCFRYDCNRPFWFCCCFENDAIQVMFYHSHVCHGTTNVRTAASAIIVHERSRKKQARTTKLNLALNVCVFFIFSIALGKC